MCIPQYKTVAGLCLPEAEIVKGHKQTRILNTTVEECIEYTKVLEERRKVSSLPSRWAS